MATFVLVHGTGGGSWVWRGVAAVLRGAGEQVFAPTLSGVGDRSHLVDCGIDLETHVRDIVNLLFYEDLTDVVLVGHSYAGMVITAVAARAHERLRQLIYLDAYVPEEGQSEADLWPESLRADAEEGAEGLRPPPPMDLLGVSDPELRSWAEQRITAQPMATYTQPAPVQSAASAALPRSYVSLTAGPTLEVFGTFARKARERGWPVREIADGHMAPLTSPGMVAATLRELVSDA